jgi:hypothetical protein
MASKQRGSKPSKDPTIRKSTRKVVKTTRSQQAELESEAEELAPAKQVSSADEEDDFYVNDEEEEAFRRREEEEESEEEDKGQEEADEDREEQEEEEEEEEDDEDDDELRAVPVVPQKRKNCKDTKKPSSKLSHIICSPSIFSKSSPERVHRHEPEEVAETRKITYNLTIFSLAELAKPQARREPAARFLVLPSNLEWLDIHGQLKIKAGDALFPGQAAIHDDAYEITFCIARHVPNPLPLSCIADYNHLVTNALRQQQPMVKIIIKATTQPQVRLQFGVYIPSNQYLILLGHRRERECTACCRFSRHR